MLLNQARAQRLMHADGLAGLVATTPENVAYLTGFWAPSAWRHLRRQVCALLPGDERIPPCLILPATIADIAAQNEQPGTNLYLYGLFHIDGAGADVVSARLQDLLHRAPRFATSVQALTTALKDSGMSAGRVGVDDSGAVDEVCKRLMQALPGVTLIDAAALFRRIRTIKTPEEVHRIQQATAATEAAFEAALGVLGRGCTESEIAEAFRTEIIRRQALPTLVCIGAGPRGAFPNVEPSDYRACRGDVVRFDIGCLYRNYHSDVARTAALGDPPSEMRAMYAAVYAGLRAALALIRPGITASAIFRAAVEAVEAEGLQPYLRHHCGHGEGLEGYEPPMLAPDDHTVLEPGMVLCVETPYYRLGVGGVQVEETVLVTETGYRSLCTLPLELCMLA